MRDACLQRANWPALCAYASSLNGNTPCTLLDKSTSGGVHLIRLVDFKGTTNTQWIARIQLEPSTPETATALRAEIAAMELVRSRNGDGARGGTTTEILVVPHIYGYEADDANVVGAAFILMELLPGSSAMDAAGGYDVHRGRVPLEWMRRAFYRQMASIQVHLSSIRLPRIGTIVQRSSENSFEVGPLPGLGGPFSTATAFLKAWASHARFRFPRTDAQIQQCAQGGPVEEILQSIHDFPCRLAELASKISKYDEGPFPLHHPDLYTSNIIVDDSFRVLGIIDWEGPCSVPWEVVQPPLFLTTLPRAMDDPGNYDTEGRLKDADGVQRLRDRDEYLGYVQVVEREREFGVDQRLSAVLSDPAAQGLAYALKVYLDPGKLGLYCNVLDVFSSSVAWTIILERTGAEPFPVSWGSGFFCAFGVQQAVSTSTLEV